MLVISARKIILSKQMVEKHVLIKMRTMDTYFQMATLPKEK